MMFAHDLRDLQVRISLKTAKFIGLCNARKMHTIHRKR
jgi:hypothetical protein